MRQDFVSSGVISNALYFQSHSKIAVFLKTHNKNFLNIMFSIVTLKNMQLNITY